MWYFKDHLGGKTMKERGNINVELQDRSDYLAPRVDHNTRTEKHLER